MWRVTTNNECWGFDISVNNLIAAGCHDGVIYVANHQGKLLWQKNISGNNLNREVEFSPDGKYLFTGPYYQNDVVLMNSETGELMWTYTEPREWLRNSRFSNDGKRIIAGFGNGELIMLDEQGKQLWKAYIGEFPLLLEIDKDYNVYASGKNRELFSFDGNGNLRWRKRIPNHVITAGSMSDDGKFIIFGTVGDWLYAFDDTGNILWQHHGTMGHNSIALMPDASLIMDGSGSIYNKNGTLIWKYPYDSTHSAVAISSDGKYIATGDEKSTIRIFERE